MSKLQVTIEKVRSVLPHPNADKLDIIIVQGWNCIVKKKSLKIDDLIVYFPIDSLLPKELEDQIFGSEAKIRLDGKKVKTIKIRGQYSQGLAVPLSKFPALLKEKAGTDLTEQLGIKKWEPAEDDYKGANLKGRTASKKELNPFFNKYTDLQHLRKHHDWFSTDDIVVVTEKLHGTSARYAKLPNDVNSHSPWWKKVLGALKLLPQFQFCYGSRNVQLQTRWMKSRFTFKDLPKDAYTKILKQENLKKKIKNGESIYGEIIGHGVQRNYFYGHKEGCLSFYVYDIQQNGRWLDHEEIAKVITGPSTICPSQLIREGGVTRTLKESVGPDGNSRKMTKWVSEEFLFRNDADGGTDIH